MDRANHVGEAQIEAVGEHAITVVLDGLSNQSRRSYTGHASSRLESLLQGLVESNAFHWLFNFIRITISVRMYYAAQANTRRGTLVAAVRSGIALVSRRYTSGTGPSFGRLLQSAPTC
jgi:hypothetical protein